jgi:hypothetical protein
VTDITHAGKRAAAPDAPEHFDNRSATFSVISVSPSFRLADRKFPRLDSPFLPCLIDIRAGRDDLKKTKTIIKRLLRKKQLASFVA